jgi:hypothetical protein
MNRKLMGVFLLLAVLGFMSAAASATDIPIGFISYDVVAPGNDARFDIVNETGPNSSPFPDPTFPVVTPESLTGLSLHVDFSDGSSSTFGSSYFTLAADGLSFNGGTIPIGGANPKPIDATLTGTFAVTTLTLNDGSVVTIDPTFTAFFSDSPTLVDGDFAIINATTTGAVATPESSSLSMLIIGMLGLLLLYERRRLMGTLRTLSSAAGRTAMPLALVLVCFLLIPAAQAFGQVHLNTWTAPDNGVGGVDNVNINGTGYPAGTITPANVVVNWAAICGGPALATNFANSVKTIIGTARRINDNVPNLATGLYFVSVSDGAIGDANFTSANCSQVNVTHTNPTLSACVPTSSLGIVAPPTGPAPVKAVVPNGAWCCGGTGIQVVQLETGGGPVVPPASIATDGDTINSCAGNPATGESVCVANNAHVYHLDTSNVPTVLTSGSDAATGFSGGSCQNCGVAVNALTNQAVIAMGHSGASGSALQTVDLATNTFGAPLSLFNHVSEDISIDPTRGYILSPNESNNYDIVQITSSTGAFTGEFGHPTGTPGELDSAAEDCSTGIALSVGEFSNTVYLADLTQATFTPGTPGSWTAPQAAPSIIGSYSAGLSGVTVAPGSGHLAAVTGEFGGSSFSVLQLPSTSGSGTPSIIDYAYVTCINNFSAGFDPHTVSAYTSPNDGKAYVVFANWSSGVPASLAVVDMAGILARPRQADGHTVVGDPGLGSCLAAGDGVVRFVATH